MLTYTLTYRYITFLMGIWCERYIHINNKNCGRIIMLNCNNYAHVFMRAVWRHNKLNENITCLMLLMIIAGRLLTSMRITGLNWMLGPISSSCCMLGHNVVFAAATLLLVAPRWRTTVLMNSHSLCQEQKI